MKTGNCRPALVLALTLAVLAASPVAAANPNGAADRAFLERATSKTSTLVYHDLWRELWEDHIVWTRMAILGVFEELPGLPEYQARLLQNAEDMEQALTPYFGEDAEALGDLIREHLLIAVEILEAAKAGDQAALDDAIARWYANGEQIAAAMHDVNPKFWPLTEASTMWREHLDATLAEALAILGGDAAGDVAAYDRIHDLALEMADFISDGVVRLFHQQFAVGCVRGRK
jgi:hypothetical protein